MSSSRKIIKAGSVAISPLKGSDAGSFANPAWDRGAAANATLRDREPEARPEGRDAAHLEQRLREAYDRGYREGILVEKNQVSGRDSAVLSALEKTRRQCLDLKEELYGTLEGQVVTLAFALAEKIIRREVSLNREILMDTLSGILQGIKDKTELVVRINPDDEKTLKERYSGDQESGGTIHFMADAAIKSGDVIVETAGLVVDARIMEQLEILRASLPGREASAEL